ncbi:MAG TPA: methyltransferase domain-containing protein [Candidatus Binataceae bacterium]|nr:methyltransferase domain-containing protein [Candidatus Binataceae bacterium]
MANPYYKQHWIEVEPERQQAYDVILAFHPALEPLLRPLGPLEGLRVLDVGSGPGHTTMELARRAGPSGHVTGVDINADFVAAATRRAREKDLAIEYVQSEFPPLPFPAESFDRVFCKNVLEYVDSAALTVKEMARVAAPGATVLAIDSDWDMLALDLPEPARELSDRAIAAAKSIAVREPKIGRMLYRLFREAGLSEVKLEIFAGADTTGRTAAMLKASQSRYARDSGRITEAEIQRWLGDIDQAIAKGQYLMVLPQFVVRGVKSAGASAR